LFCYEAWRENSAAFIGAAALHFMERGEGKENMKELYVSQHF